MADAGKPARLKYVIINALNRWQRKEIRMGENNYVERDPRSLKRLKGQSPERSSRDPLSMEWDEIEARSRELHPERWKPGESQANLREHNAKMAAEHSRKAKEAAKDRQRGPDGRFVKQAMCRSGRHVLERDNVLVGTNGTRCRACWNERNAMYMRATGDPRKRAKKLGPVVASSMERFWFKAECELRLVYRQAGLKPPKCEGLGD